MKSLSPAFAVVLVCFFSSQTLAKPKGFKPAGETIIGLLQEGDNCTFDFQNAKSALDNNSDAFLSIKNPVRNNEKRVLTQKAVLKNGKVKVEFLTGGCAHYGYHFKFSNLKQKSFTADQAFRKVIELLKATPATVEGQALTKTLIEALELAAMNKILRPPNENYDIPCGEANCSLDVKTKGELKASYDFAL